MSDLALKAVGLACAAGSVWFAVFMFKHQDGAPRIYAMQDFAIFAQPNRVKAVEAAVRAAGAEGRTRGPKRMITIDMTPVGAVPPHPEPGSQPERHNVRIVELNDDNALLESANGFRRVRIGDEAPGIGKVIAIRRMGDYWVVVASQRSLAQVAPAIPEGPPATP
jgi:hypothetical protein